MRTQKQLVIYQSILEVLQEPGCPFCRFLKEYQAARLQHHSEQDIHHLCNFHTWGLAAVQNALTAAAGIHQSRRGAGANFQRCRRL